jgi:DNA end-binding protein Ku
MPEPLDQGLMATTLRYGYEIRDAKPYFEDIPSVRLPDEMVKLAEHILDPRRPILSRLNLRIVMKMP